MKNKTAEHLLKKQNGDRFFWEEFNAVQVLKTAMIFIGLVLIAYLVGYVIREMNEIQMLLRIIAGK